MVDGPTTRYIEPRAAHGVVATPNPLDKLDSFTSVSLGQDSAKSENRSGGPIDIGVRLGRKVHWL